ncbi:MAG: Rpn family recombination-promoting nuclease/putative transposase, partial [Treponema sp.]|nr:Rpn family recombination-promoting nuclease/putative transposase [Treponema sp.]
METERLNPLNDFLFFKMMGEKGDEEQLLSFLNAVLGRTGERVLVSIEIIEARSLSADIIGNKSSV